MKEVWRARRAQLAITAKLWNAVNDRRCALIEREHDAGLTDAEAAELARLQLLADEYVRAVAPLPIAQLERLVGELEEKYGKDEL